MPVEAFGVDSGYSAQAIYNYVRPHQHARVLATKGIPGKRPALGFGALAVGLCLLAAFLVLPALLQLLWPGQGRPEQR